MFAVVHALLPSFLRQLALLGTCGPQAGPAPDSPRGQGGRVVTSGCLLPPSTPPPLVVPRGGGAGPSLGQPKFFHCGSLCCCVGDCVVGHYHLHPLHSWQGILLTFAEMELDSTTMFPPGTSVMFIHSTGEPVLASRSSLKVKE